MYFFKIYLIYFFIYFLVRILLYIFRVLIVVVFCKWCQSYFYTVLSICNHFYTTPEALSFKPYRVWIKDMYVCMYARGNDWWRIRVRHSSRKESSFSAEMPLIKSVDIGAANRQSTLIPRKFVALNTGTPRSRCVLTEKPFLCQKHAYTFCQNIPTLTGFSE